MATKIKTYKTVIHTGEILKVDSSLESTLELSILCGDEELFCNLDLGQAKELHDQIAIWIGYHEA